MADELVQQLGFDASDALAALAKLDTNLASFDAALTMVGETLGTWNAKGRETVQVLKDIASGAASAVAAMSKLASVTSGQSAAGGASGGGQAAQNQSTREAAHLAQMRTASETYEAKVAKLDGLLQSGAVSQDTYNRAVAQASAKLADADQAAAKFTVSWETMARVITTQFIVRALSAFRDAIREAFDSNLQFMTRVAEIQSVAPGVNTSLDSISQHLADLSRQFNIPLAQVAEAQYQAISNQFTTTAQQTDVLTAAFKLSKVAVMDAGAAVNLIAGTLNAYQMSSSQAEAVAARFFATIQIGRVRGEELASTLSRVYAVSATLGIGLDELNAMLVTLTVAGVKPTEAATSLRSAMMALIKPTTDLTKELHDLGFESGADGCGLRAGRHVPQAARQHRRKHRGLCQTDSQHPGPSRRVARDGGRRPANRGRLEAPPRRRYHRVQREVQVVHRKRCAEDARGDQQAEGLLDDGPGGGDR